MKSWFDFASDPMFFHNLETCSFIKRYWILLVGYKKTLKSGMEGRKKPHSSNKIRSSSVTILSFDKASTQTCDIESIKTQSCPSTPPVIEGNIEQFGDFKLSHLSEIIAQTLFCIFFGFIYSIKQQYKEYC